MQRVVHIPKSPLSRRTFLRGAGVAMAIPMLDAMTPAFGAGVAGSSAAGELPRRMVAIQTNMGIMPQFFFPEKPGTEYELTPYLYQLAAHKKNMTVFSGTSYPGVTGGHTADRCFLTATPHPDRGGFRNGVSLDQFAAEQIGNVTRYPSLSLQVSSENRTLSYTRSGAPITAEGSPHKLFLRLFAQGSAKEVEASVDALRQGRSMLDFVGDQSKRLNRSLSASDQRRMDQYFTSVRELEQRLHAAEAWEYKPKPVVSAKPPEDIDDIKRFVDRSRMTFDVMKLALETDSTRIITLFIDTTVIHNITHHGNRPEVVAELRGHEERQFGALAAFLDELSDSKEHGQSLLDRTMVLYGTCMGSANSHSNVNLPALIAGGGFKHGQHLAFDKERNYPLSNVFVSMLQRMGLEVGEFSTGKSTMKGLEFA